MLSIFKLSTRAEQNRHILSSHCLNSVRADPPILRDDVQQPPHALDIGVVAI